MCWSYPVIQMIWTLIYGSFQKNSINNFQFPSFSFGQDIIKNMQKCLIFSKSLCVGFLKKSYVLASQLAIIFRIKVNNEIDVKLSKIFFIKSLLKMLINAYWPDLIMNISIIWRLLLFINKIFLYELFV